MVASIFVEEDISPTLGIIYWSILHYLGCMDGHEMVGTQIYMIFDSGCCCFITLSKRQSCFSRILTLC
jgi:hypothetical protein